MKIRTDLIDKEIQELGKGLEYKRLKPSNRFIDWLFRHYYTVEFTEHFYDSEPDYDDDEFDMYMDYLYIHEQIDLSALSFYNTLLKLDEIQEQQENFRYSKEPHTMAELKAAYDNILKQREEYEERRLSFRNWIEPYFKGNWDMSQKYVDKFAREVLKNTKKAPFSYNGRLFIAEKDDYIHIYYFGRDYKKVDYWWVMKKRGTKEDNMLFKF